jgi:hypothetical protein
VVEPYTAASRFAFDPSVAGAQEATCGADFDFAIGTSFAIRAGKERRNLVCQTHEGIPSGIPRVALGRALRPPAAETGNSAFVSPYYEATVGDGCAGQEWHLDISVWARDPFAEPRVGEKPNVVMIREFWPAMRTSPACQAAGANGTRANPSVALCRDAFVVKLEPMP